MSLFSGRRTLCPLLLALLIAAPSAPVNADDVIRLAEIVPLLEGSPAGNVVVAPAPAVGSERRVRRSEVIAALREAGLSSEGLAIPRVTRIRREATVLEGDELEARAMPVITAALAPCTVTDVRLPRSVRLPSGELHIEATGSAPRRASRASGVLLLEAGGSVRRLPYSARVQCPPQEIRSGAQLTLVVRIGSVQASAPGEATQPGRIGEIIRVRNTATRRALMARIIDSETAEVVQ